MAEYMNSVANELLPGLLSEGMAKLVATELNQVLEVQMSERLGAAPYERTEERRGYRNGFADTLEDQARLEPANVVQQHTMKLASVNGYASPSRDRRAKASRRADENESARRYRLLVEHASEIIFETDASGNFVFFNTEAAFKILQYSKEELLGRHFLSLVRPDWREEVANFYQEQLRKKTEVTYFEFPVLAQDRTEVWFGQSLRLVHRDDEVVALQAFCRDITDNRRRQHELERSQERLRELSSRLEAAREAERTNIAREMHDELGALLTLMKLDLRWYAKDLGVDAGEEKLAPIIQLVDSAIESVQRICTQLRPSILDQLGLVAAIEWQAKEFEERLGIPCKLEINARAPRVEQEPSVPT